VKARITNLRVLTLMIALAAIATACGSDASLSPTSPSAIGTRPSRAASGAVITGTVSGMALSTLSLSEGVTTAATTKPVTVTVVGTNISTVIDGAGRFHLDNVPPGDVRLRFTATGLDATLTLFGVQVGDRIDLKVRVTDTSVRIEAERRERDDDDEDEDDDENELEGVVSNLRDTCPTITFTVQGMTVKTNNTTIFKDGPCTRIANGRRVEVEGTRQGDGTILATEVELDD
jgi:hypothetical protein